MVRSFLAVSSEVVTQFRIQGRRKSHRKQIFMAAGNMNKDESKLRHRQKEYLTLEIKHLQTSTGGSKIK